MRSIGKVLDAYFSFSEPGDTCLGRILAKYNPNDSYFAPMDPHDSTQDEHLNEAMNCIRGPILAQWKDNTSIPFSILSLFLTSVIYHKCWIKELISKNAIHSF